MCFVPIMRASSLHCSLFMLLSCAFGLDWLVVMSHVMSHVMWFEVAVRYLVECRKEVEKMPIKIVTSIRRKRRQKDLLAILNALSQACHAYSHFSPFGFIVKKRPSFYLN
jgi:hypothetical protein